MDPMGDTALKTKVFTLKHDDSHMLSGSKNYITIVFREVQQFKVVSEKCFDGKKKNQEKVEDGLVFGTGL